MAFKDDRRPGDFLKDRMGRNKRGGGPGWIGFAVTALLGLVAASILGGSLLAIGFSLAGVALVATAGATILAFLAPVVFLVWGLAKGLLLLTFVAGAGAGLLGWQALTKGGLKQPEVAGKLAGKLGGQFKPAAESSWEEREEKVARDLDEVARLQRKELSDFDRRLERRERDKYFEL